MNKAGAFAAVMDEFDKAMVAHKSFNSPHEGHSVIEEEFDELWDEIKVRNQSVSRMREEAVQLAAMAIRFIVELT
jgi:hypothetical protein